MSNNKQSSVEWFAQESWKLRIELEAGKISMGEYANKYYQLKEQAKAMHRVEIIESYAIGSNDRLKNTINTNYYTETFGGNNED